MAVTGAKQRLLAINVGEVSIVDHPANEEDFVVTKSIPADEALGIEQGILKAAWTTAYINNLPNSSFLYVEPGKDDEDGKRVPRSLRHFPVRDDKGNLDKNHLDNALARIPDSEVPDAVKAHAKAEAEKLLTQFHNAHSAQKAEVTKLLSSMYGMSPADSERIMKMLDKSQQFASVISKMCDDLKTAVAKAAEPDADDEGKDGKKPPKGKLPPALAAHMKKLADVIKDSADGDAEYSDAGVSMADDEEKKTKALGQIIELVTKRGGKQFSKERLAKLHEAFKHLATTLKEADPTGFNTYKDIFTGKPADANSGGQADDNGNPTEQDPVPQPKPAAPANGSANKAGEGAGAAASAPPAWFSSAIEGLKKDLSAQVESVSKRVEAVEKVEAVSKALPHGNKDGQPVKKNESMWKGIL